MNVGHEDEANSAGYNAKQLNFVITLYAASKLVGDLHMEAYNQYTGDHDGDAD